MVLDHILFPPHPNGFSGSPTKNTCFSTICSEIQTEKQIVKALEDASKWTDIIDLPGRYFPLASTNSIRAAAVKSQPSPPGLEVKYAVSAICVFI